MPHAFPRLASRVRPVAVLLILLLGTACGGDSVFVPKIEDTAPDEVHVNLDDTVIPITRPHLDGFVTSFRYNYRAQVQSLMEPMGSENKSG